MALAGLLHILFVSVDLCCLLWCVRLCLVFVVVCKLWLVPVALCADRLALTYHSCLFGQFGLHTKWATSELGQVLGDLNKHKPTQ